MSSNKKRRELNRAITESNLARALAESATSKHTMLNIAESALAKRVLDLEKQVDDLERWKWKQQHNAKLGAAIEEAAKLLPEGFVISVEVEKDAGWVNLHDLDGEEVEVPCGDYLYETVYNAINIAEALQEKESKCVEP